MPYSVGRKGSYRCSGYPVVDEGGKVVGCHPTRAAADNHLQALYANVSEAKKSEIAGANPSFTIDPKYPGVGIKRPKQSNLNSSIIPTQTRQKSRKTRRGISSDASSGASGAVSSGGSGGSLG